MLRSLIFSLFALSSAAMAQDAQRFGLGTQISMHGGVPVSGVELVMPVAPDLQMNYAFVQGRTDLSSQVNASVVPYISRADFGLSEASVTLRYLFSNSFYAGAGAGYRSIDLKIEGLDWIDGTTFDGRYKSQAFQAKAMIGNGWTFSNGLYLAVDWIGFAAPFAVTQSEFGATETSLDRSLSLTRNEENDPEYKRAADKISRTTMGTLLTLRLGFNF
jgi:hypothetical protein